MSLSSKDYFWHCVLTKDEPTVQWNPSEEAGDDDDDEDFLTHTLQLHNATVVESKDSTYVEAQSQTFNGSVAKGMIFGLTPGQVNCPLTISFQNPVSLTLTRGKGPVHISGSHNIALAPDDSDIDDSEEEASFQTPDSVSSRKKRLSDASGSLPSSKKAKLGKSPLAATVGAGDSKPKPKPIAIDAKPKNKIATSSKKVKDEEESSSDDDDDEMDMDDEKMKLLMEGNLDDDSDDDDADFEMGDESDDEDDDIDSDDEDESEDEEDIDEKIQKELSKKKAVDSPKKVQLNGKATPKELTAKKEKKVPVDGSKTPKDQDKLKDPKKVLEMGEMKQILKKTPALPKTPLKFNNFIQSRFKIPREEVEKRGPKLWKWIQEGMKAE